MNGNKPAFPTTRDVVPIGNAGETACGLTKRELIAAILAQGFISSGQQISLPAEPVRLADQLIAELDRTARD